MHLEWDMQGSRFVGSLLGCDAELYLQIELADGLLLYVGVCVAWLRLHTVSDLLHLLGVIITSLDANLNQNVLRMVNLGIIK